MRKILTSVLSVAGLLAVVLALVSSPASAEKDVVTIKSPAAGDNAGTYVISWETLGDCNPGSGTGGSSGSVTLEVVESFPGSKMGDQQETGVVIDDDCKYTWKATFTNAAGADCLVGAPDSDDVGTALDAIRTAEMIMLATGDCATTGKLVVTVRGHGAIYVGDCTGANREIVNGQCQSAGDDDDGALLAETTEAAAKARGDKGLTAEQRNAGAVANTVFTVTATPQKVNNKVPQGCKEVSGDTEIVYDTGGLQRATLTVVDRPLGGTDDTCIYTVTAALPAGFAAGGGEVRSMANSKKDQNPNDMAGPDGVPGNADDMFTKANVHVSVAGVKVYLVQNVIGDAGSASATYKLDTPCGAPGLPAALTARPASGGISTTKAVVNVELRTGRFNVTAAVAPDPAAANAADGVMKHALAEDGKACEASVSVSNVPDHCSAEGASASLASASGSAILEVTVDCTPPPAPEPPAADTGDMGADDMGADDMGADDMGADDMGADDMGADDMGGMDMGPPEDVATG
jgi:hypothetical protein